MIASIKARALPRSCSREPGIQRSWLPSPRRCWGVVPTQQPTWVANSLANIKVVGVGGAASTAVGQLWDTEACSNLSMAAIDTDVQELTNIFLPDQDRVLIGARTTEWGGTRGDPLLGQDAALESSADIEEALLGADLVFVLAGMGGGTGRGAAPVVAGIARRQGTFTVGIALSATHQHLQALQRLHDAVDVFLALPSPADDAADAHLLPLSTCIQGVAGLVGGYEPMAVADLQDMLSGGGSALWCAVARGPDRVVRAATAVMSSPECLGSLQVASAVLCFVSSADGRLDESQVEAAQEVVARWCLPSANLHVRAVDASEHLPAGHTCVTLVVTAHAPLPDTGREGRQAAGSGAVIGQDSSSSRSERSSTDSSNDSSTDMGSSGSGSGGSSGRSSEGGSKSSSSSSRPGVLADVSDAAAPAPAAAGDPPDQATGARGGGNGAAGPGRLSASSGVPFVQGADKAPASEDSTHAD